MAITQEFSKKYMARKCGNCGAPAPDTNSRFCDLCGAPLIEEPVVPQGLPVCPACGAIVSDKKAQFCDVCGAPLAKPVCPTCGNPAPSFRSKFCTRCGSPYVQTGPGKTRVQSPSVAVPEPKNEPEPVVVKLRKGRLPIPDDPSMEWDPWSDGDPSYDISSPLPQQKRPVTDYGSETESVPQRREPPQNRDLKITGPQKKYSHLPLVAEELKKDSRKQLSTDGKDMGEPQRKGKKSGPFKFF